MKKNLLLIIFCLIAFISKSQVTLAVAGLDETCFGACDGQAIVIPSGGTPGYTYFWSSGCTTSNCGGLCQGSYTVTVSDAIGSTATATVNILGPSSPIVLAPISDETICIGQNVLLAAGAFGGTAPYTYVWPSLGVGSTFIVSPATTTTYTATATDVNGCSAAPLTVTVFVLPPLAVVSAGTALICIGNSTTISATAFGGNGGPYTYTWTPVGTVGSSVSVSPTTTTIYTVTADDGCSAVSVATVTVTIDPCLGVQSLTNENTIFNVFPNPFSSRTTIDLNTNYKNATLKIIDVLGKELRSINFSGKLVIIEREELNNGIYFIQIIDENKVVATNKIIIQ